MVDGACKISSINQSTSSAVQLLPSRLVIKLKDNLMYIGMLHLGAHVTLTLF